jgi:two-component system LytT family sensor kinase
MKTTVKAGIHLFYWIFSCLLIFSLIRVSFGYYVPTVIIVKFNILGIFLSATGFYAGYTFLFPRYLARQQVRQTVWKSILIGMTIGLAGVFLAPLLILPARISHNVSGDLIFFTVCTLFSLIHVISGCFIHGFITWYDDIRYKQTLEKKNLQTELALLKAQINPHFLFNTLNNIDVLIEKDALKASAYLKKLSDILRFMLYENQSEQIELAQELSYIEKYIELQKIRTSNANFVCFEVRGHPEGIKVPPMIFIPFIENAFKHATDKKIDKAIDIFIFIKEQELHFSCINTFREEGSIVDKNSGLGVNLIKNRLDLLYNTNYRLDVVKSENKFSVQLKLLLNDH